MTQLEIEIRCKTYPPADRTTGHVALSNVHMSLKDREFVCVLGPSGCGKTTLLNCVAGLDRDFEGRVSLPSVADRTAAVIGYVFQNPRLLPWRSVRENIELVLNDAAGGKTAIKALIADAGLEDLRDAYPERLSLGQERRVALIRAFAIQPDVLLMDEPFVSLDEPTAQRLRLLLLQVWRQRPTTVLFVTHDLREAIQLADRVVLLSPGPGTVVAEIPVDLSREDRVASERLEDYRREMIVAYPALAQEPS